jgi:putative endonuclease
MSIMAYMYILECCDESFYTGSTKNLPRRLWQHQNGMGANHTAKRLPVKLVYAEEFEHVADAFYREKQVQGWSRAKKMALIQGDWDKLHILAECQNESHCWGSGFGSLRQAQGNAAQPANTSAQPAEDLRAERSRSPDSESR